MQGTPCWVPDSPFRRYPSTFRGVWRVKRPLNPTKQGPLCPYRRENHIDTTSVLREKRQKPKEARSKKRIDGAWPTPEPPSRGARPCGLAMAEPRRRRGSAIPWPSPIWSRGPPAGSPTVRFGDILRRFEVFGGSNDL